MLTIFHFNMTCNTEILARLLALLRLILDEASVLHTCHLDLCNITSKNPPNQELNRHFELEGTT